MINKKIKILTYPFTVTSVLYFIFMFTFFKYISFQEDDHRIIKESRLIEKLNFIKSKLENIIYSRLYLTKAIGSYVALNPEVTQKEFEDFASKLIDQDSLIYDIALAKNCIISHIYPLKGAEKAIGLDLKNHPQRANIVDKTIFEQKTFISGPVELVEGGQAFIGYYPIFNKNGTLWGLSDIVFLKDRILNEINLEPIAGDIKVAIQGKDSKGANGGFFYGDSTIVKLNPVKVSVELPLGNWVINAIPKDEWKSINEQNNELWWIGIISITIFTILIYFLMRIFLKYYLNIIHIKALFMAINDSVLEFDKDGNFYNVDSINKNEFIKYIHKINKTNVFQIFSKDTAQMMIDFISHTLTIKQKSIVEFPFEIEGNNYWYEATISPFNSTKVIMVIRNITERNSNIEIIRDSQLKLKELNATKDKFFSIIAHDLKNPLGGTRNLLKLSISDYDDFSESEIKEVIKVSAESVELLYKLLENLLDWSRAQQGKLNYNPGNHDIFYCLHRVLELNSTPLKEKNIKIINKIKENTFAFYDIDLISTVLRNLISNAIKFSEFESEIHIYNETLSVNGKYYQKLSIKDFGVGMSKDTQDKLFKIESKSIEIGTNNEKGTGLGLILCKEFIELNNGFIEVESQEKIGSIFSFYIPKENN